MVTCIFYLKGRTKIITKEFANNCWIDFKMDFGEDFIYNVNDGKNQELRYIPLLE